MITIWFEPHATTFDNEAERASGWNDVDLSPLGLKQANEMILRTKERGIEAIFCSDSQRAVKTAIPTANELKIPIFIDERLRECDYGDFTLKPKNEVWSVKLNHIEEPFPGGESYTQVVSRVGSFLEWLKKDFDGKNVMIIGHRGTHHGLDCHIDGVDIKEAVGHKFVWQPGWKYVIK